MTKEIKKCFYRLNLHFHASIDEVLINEKIKIKILRAKQIKTKRSYTKKINQVVADSNVVIDFIKNNGPIPYKEPLFDTPIKSIFTQLVILIFMVVMFITCLFNII